MAITQALSNWDFNQFHVQLDVEAGEFIDAFTTLIAAGPPKLRQAGGASSVQPVGSSQAPAAVAYPIGVIENFAMAQNRQLQRLFEIGSKRSYFIMGRNIGNLQLARTLFHGPNLLRSLYAYYPASKIDTSVAKLLAALSGPVVEAAPKIRDRPGFSDFFINLDSDIFDQPFGLFVIMQDSRNQPYAGVYLEDCFLRAHQWSINASSTLVAEGITAEFDKAVPVDVGAIARTTAADTRAA